MAKKKKKPIDKKVKARCSRLAWEILGHKFMYYEGAKHILENGEDTLRDKCIDDSKYDAIEDEYRGLCEELGEEPSAADMVGFDSSKPSCRMVKEQLIAHGGKFPGSSVKHVKETTKKIRKKISVFMETLQEVMDEVELDEKKQKKIRIRMKKKFKP